MRRLVHIVLGLLIAACVPTEREQNSTTLIRLADYLRLAVLQPERHFDKLDNSPLEFPADHGAHPAQRLDVWSALFWLHDSSARDFTAQLVIVRLAGKPGAPQRGSRWATHEIYMGRLSAQNSAGQDWQAERLARGALGLSGADSGRVWLEQWRLAYPRAGAEIHVESAELALQMQWLNTAQPQAITLLPGFSASPLGYAQTPIAVAGQLRLNQQSITVTGQAWFDHVWGNGLPLASGQLGVVRLRALLDDGTWLDCMQLRRRNGGGTPLGGCTLYNGETTLNLDRRAVNLSPRYALSERLPLEWTLRISQADLSLRVYVQGEPEAIPLIALPALIEGYIQGRTIQGKAWLELGGFELSNSS